ncbi:hypothetical protein [Gimesia maris]|uniref:Uncharacterized protein n=1 Tax=Gimesia maris TaxID=122 RepID=A0ABX5YLF6_9PLAN|nr:hypothetical protein [Gimesia maris]EDL56266.1 hypothetical protein PM8797T_00482 [Gimesia maris DSM 8797]QEG16445.1 hypothetical protein GmarT_23100 [Gimesia maris]
MTWNQVENDLENEWFCYGQVDGPSIQNQETIDIGGNPARQGES